MPTIRVNNIDLYFEIEGQGQPLLLLAGYSCDHTQWASVANVLRRSYQVIAVDNRGIGRSSSPDEPYSAAQMADDALALLDHLGIGQAYVAGHSFGGQIAQELTIHYPKRVRALLLLSTFAELNEKQKTLLNAFGEIPNQLPFDLLVRVVLPWMFTDEFYATPGAIEQVVANLQANPFPPTAHGLYRQSRAVSASNTTARLDAITCATLVLTGREDLLIPVHCGERLAKGIRNCALVVLEKAGHDFLTERPNDVANAMMAFLAKY